MERELRVAVITPYYKARPDWLLQCHESVRGQTHPCTHILIADGTPDPCVEQWNAQHIVIGHNLADYGDTPRAIGSMAAMGQGFDAITYLDADNWYLPDHIATLVELHRKTGAIVCTSSRTLHRLDGSVLGKCPENDGESFADTSCVMLIGRAREMSMAWACIAPGVHPIDDRVMWTLIKRRDYPRAHTGRRTVAYRTAYAGHYLQFKETPPAGVKSGDDVIAALIRAKELGFGDLYPSAPWSQGL